MGYNEKKYVRVTVDLTKDEHRRLHVRTDGQVFKSEYIRQSVREKLERDEKAVKEIRR